MREHWGSLMLEVEAPGAYGHADLFLAGGITGTWDWQARALDLLQETPGVVLNPRRSRDFRAEDAAAQIRWEHAALRSVNAILFWFPPETLCPITLFELGVWSERSTPLFVGTDPAYARRFDVVEQLRLSRPELVVCDDLALTVGAYQAWRAGK